MIPAKINSIFKSGSKTYSTSSLFFPKQIRENVTVLYAFVRTLDNFVDNKPQDIKGFHQFKNEYYQARKHDVSKNHIIQLFHSLEKKFGINPQWTDNFIQSMEMDIAKKKYKNLKEVEQYMYGSANVIGLYMAKLLDLPTDSYRYAEMLGKSMQFLNFIRDINEDLSFGRTYFPQNELHQFGLKSLHFQEVNNKKDKFIQFIRFQLDRYREWQKVAERGFKFIPKRLLIPIKTASDMYKWTGEVIRKDPFIIYRKKVKPSAFRIVLTGIFNVFR